MNIEALNNLNQFTGGGDQYKYNFRLLITEGVHFLCENAQCYWLIDAIGSYQAQLRKSQRLQEFQVWELVVDNKTALLTCREDSDCDPVVTQRIPYTDFPLPKIVLWVEGCVVLLPSEH